MTTMFIRVKKDGSIYADNPILRENADCELITEQEAFPERFAPAHVADRIVDPAKAATKSTKRKNSGLTLETPDIPEAPKFTSQELAVEASRNLP